MVITPRTGFQPDGPRRNTLPPGRFVRRARGPYVYDQHGDRYLDMWLQDGAAFLGHRPPGYGQLAKAEIDRGLWGAFPTPWHQRLVRAVSRLSEVASINAPGGIRIANGSDSLDSATRWLPTGGVLAPVGGSMSDGTMVSIVLPAPGVIVAGTRHVESLPSIVAALLCRAADNLSEYLETNECRERVAESVASPIPPGYTRYGVWLISEECPEGRGADEWADVVDHALRFHVLLPPDSRTPIVFPPGMSAHDRDLWRKVCDGWPV